MDLSKLTPTRAPWKVHKSCAPGHSIVMAGRRRVCPALAADAELIALARNALDVMMRREWGVGGASRWWAALPPTECPEKFRRWCDDHYFPDPFTALIEADHWYREHVEGAAGG